uniref:F-box domain-containing protein n=1 Tax=Caenorhabditis tropicalis TaxID=1561998 RepID=A0A1I7U9H5_9PELO
MSFQLFSLPQPAYTNIINSMNPCEQFFTSLCSRNTYSIIKMHRHQIRNSWLYTKGNFEFHFGTNQAIHLAFHQSSNTPNRDLKQLTLEGNSVGYEVTGDKVITTYWTEPIEGTMSLLEYVGDLFNVIVTGMDIYYDSGDRLMNFVQEKQKHVRKFRFVSKDSEEKFTPETLTSLITLCDTEGIILNAYTTEPVQPFHKKCYIFAVLIGSWVTVDHLMALDCIRVYVNTKNRLTSGDLNRFIKHWMNGGNPRLKTLKIQLDNYNEQELIAGIDGKWSKRKLLHSADEERDFFNLDEFFEIQKTTNGMSAGFTFVDGSFCFGAWPCALSLFRLPQLASMNIINLMSTTEHLFGIQVDQVDIQDNRDTRIMNWVQRRQGSLKMVQVTDTRENQFGSEEMKNIMMECKAENILLSTLHSTQFEIENLNNKFEVFECLSGTWITVDNLMTLDCIRITVQEKQFTCTEMNRFIKHWLQGGSSRLAFLRVPVTEQNNEELLDGLEAQWNIEKIAVVPQQQTLLLYNGFYLVSRTDGATLGLKYFVDFFVIVLCPINMGNLLYLGHL